MENQRQPNSSGLHFHTCNCEPSFQKDVSVRLRDLWRCLESKQDLLNLVNIALESMYGDMAQTVSMKQLANMAYIGNGEHRYSSFQIPKKKKGEFRTIDAPIPLLKNIQRGLNGVLQAVYTPHSAAMGFVKGCSVVDNARTHLGQRYVYNIDLKDFFPSISSGRVYACLSSKRFSLLPEIASLICAATPTAKAARCCRKAHPLLRPSPISSASVWTASCKNWPRRTDFAIPVMPTTSLSAETRTFLHPKDGSANA